MKKFILISTAIIFMWAGSAIAQPPCGLWIAGPGTYQQTVDSDFGFRTSNTDAKMVIGGVCGSGGGMPWTYKSHTVPDTCDEHTMTGVRAVATMNGTPGFIETYPDANSPASASAANYYILYHHIRAESTTPSTIGTMQFYDFRGFCPTCPFPTRYTADTTKYELKISPMYASYASSSSPPIGCNVDMTSHPTGAPAGMHWELVMEGEITDGNNGSNVPITQYGTVQYLCQGWATFPPAFIATGARVTGQIQQMRVEVDLPLRSDLDGNGVVGLPDFNILKSEYFGTPACGCGNYWPGQSMP